MNGSYALTGYRLMQGESESVHLPARVNGIPVTTIGAYAFSDSDVKTVYLPDTITTIDENAFADSNVHNVTVSRGNAVYKSVSGVVYSKDGRRLEVYPFGRRSTSFTMPSTVLEIGEKAFARNAFLQTVTFNDVLETIGKNAFRDCIALRTVNLPDSTVTLGSGAFSGCYALASFSAYGLTEIGEDAFPTGTGMAVKGPIGDNPLRHLFVYQSESGEESTFNYNQYTVQLYLDGALADQIGQEAGTPLSTQLRDIVLDDGTYIAAWYKDSSFAKIWDYSADVMPESDLSLYASKASIYDCETVNLTANGQEITGLMLTRWYGKSRLLTVPGIYADTAVVALGDGFLSAYNDNLTSIAIPSSVVSIGDSALVNADGSDFNGVIVCDADSYAATWAEAKGYQTDTYLYNLLLVIDSERSTSMQIGKGIWQRLPVPTRAGYTFRGWYTDGAYTIPVTLEEDYYQMPGDDVTLYAAWEGTEEILNLPFEWMENNGTIAITGYTGTARSVEIPAAIGGLPVTRIEANAFEGSNIRSIDLGSVIEIGELAFSDCEYLSVVTLPDTVAVIGELAFEGCTGLYRVYVGSSLTDLSVSAFYGCGGLKYITVDSENAAFADTDGVLFTADGRTLVCYPRGKTASAYQIPNGVTTVGTNAFHGASNLTEVVVPDSLTRINDSAFVDCDSLEAISANGVLTVGREAFFGCDALENVNLGSQLTGIDSFAFSGCGALTSICIPEQTILDTNTVIFGSADQLVIIGVMGSSAQIYAEAFGIAFEDPDAQPVTAVEITGETEAMQLGDTQQLTVTLLPENATNGTNYVWSSVDPDIAFVDEEDVLHAIRCGSTVVSLRTSNGVETTYAIEVQLDVTDLTLTLPEFLAIGNTIVPEIIIMPEAATNKKLTWTTSDESMMSVDPETGELTAIGVGVAEITATTHNGIAASQTIEVFRPIEQLTLTVSSNRLFTRAPGNVNIIRATIEPADATDQTITWSSSDHNVVTVDENGIISAVGTGNATITAKAGARFGQSTQASCVITVTAIDSVMKLPDMLTEIENEAFLGSAAQGVITGDHLICIGSLAFSDMPNMAFVQLPESVSSIADDAFSASNPVLIVPANSAASEWASNQGMDWIPWSID